MNNYYTNNDSRLNDVRTALNQLSSDDLNRLMVNEDELIKFVQNLPDIKQIEIQKEQIKESNRMLACNNLERQPTLNEEKRKLIQIHEELAKLREEYRNIRGQYDDQVGESNPEMIDILLQSTAGERERLTEKTAEDFFCGTKSEEEVTTFERSFIEERRQAHELKIKAEKFHELMQMSQATSYLNSSQPFRGYR